MSHVKQLGAPFKAKREVLLFSLEYPSPGILTLFRRVCSAFLITLRGVATVQHTELAKCEVCTFDASRKVERVERPACRSGHLPRGTLSPKGAYNYDTQKGCIIMTPRSKHYSLSIRNIWDMTIYRGKYYTYV